MFYDMGLIGVVSSCVDGGRGRRGVGTRIGIGGVFSLCTGSYTGLHLG